MYKQDTKQPHRFIKGSHLVRASEGWGCGSLTAVCSVGPCIASILLREKVHSLRPHLLLSIFIIVAKLYLN